PVFPVRLPTALYEVQGERAVLDLADPAAPGLEIAWRALGDEVAAAWALLLRGDTTLWSGRLARTPGAATGSLEFARVAVPAAVARSPRAARPTLLVRPDPAVAPAPGRRGGNIAANDTVPLEIRGEGRPRHLLVR